MMLSESQICRNYTDVAWDYGVLSVLITGYCINRIFSEYNFYKKNKWDLSKDSGNDIFLEGFFCKKA